MQSYLVTVKYAPEVRQRLIQYPQNRMDAVVPVIKALGGKVDRGWVVLDEKYDEVMIVQMPSHASVAAFASTFSGGGAVGDIRIVPLMEISDWLEAIIRARQSGYQPLKVPAHPAI